MSPLHLSLKYLSWVYYLTLVFVFVIGCVRAKRIDKPTKILWIFTGIVLITEVISEYAAKKYHNNLGIYTIYAFFEFGFISLYFNYSIDSLKKRNIGIMIGATGILVGIINTLFFQPFNTINSYFIFIEGICIVGMALFSFFRLLLRDDNLRINKSPHFWFSGILSFYWSATFLNWGLYDYLAIRSDSRIDYLYVCIVVINILTYASIAVIFLLYPKMKTHIYE